MTTPSLTATSDGDVTDPATLAAQTPSVTFLGDGYGQPPVVTGTATVQTPSLAVSVAGATDARGGMSVTVPPLVALRGETRVFGERVILVEVDDRTIKVPSRALDD
jgi:Tfp pilus assembly protein PilW